MKAEVLSPVGNMEMLYAAVNNGCDAVYLGGKSFGARAFANNFTNEELKEVFDYCHLRGVRVYVTVNTLIYNDEVREFIDYISFLVSNGVDALIMQDLGMISLVREMFPNVEIHASTQAHTHNEKGIEFLKSLGVKRVVVARECELEDIKHMTDLSEIEVFVYGALCVSYSGCCLFSAMNGGRSGNRGECVGNCRMPYVLDGVTGYYLSMRDLNVINRINEVLYAGVKSLKIEGRMKSPLYVGYVTRLMRRAVDAYYEGRNFKLSDEEVDILKRLFYRGFTEGYLFGSDVLTNIDSPNHIGVRIGCVCGISNDYIKIRLDSSLKQGSGIRFRNAKEGMMVNFLYDEKRRLTNVVDKGIVYLDNKVNVKVDDEVYLTLDSSLQLDDRERKVGLSVSVIAKVGKSLQITFSDGEHVVSVNGSDVERSIKAPMSSDDIKRQLSKLGNTVYEVDKFKVDIDEGVFIRVGELNELKRKLVMELDSLRIGLKREVSCEKLPLVSKRAAKDKGISVSVMNEEQLVEVLKCNVKRVYVRDEELYRKYSGDKRVIYKAKRVFDESNCSRVMVGDNSLICSEGIKYGDYTLNVTNDYTIRLLKKYGVREVCFSLENSVERLKEYGDGDNEVLVYGRAEVMIIRKNILGKRKGCIVDRYGGDFPFYDDGILHIMDCKVVDLRKMVRELDFSSYRVDFYDESASEVVKVILEMEGLVNG